MLFKFKNVFMVLVVLFFVLALLPVILYAQGLPGDFEWGNLGVDVMVVGIIISMVQFIKKFLPQKTLAWVPLVLAMLGSGVYGIFTNLSGGVEFVVKMAFSYAAAAAWLYEIGKTIGLGKLLKGKTMVDSEDKK